MSDKQTEWTHLDAEGRLRMVDVSDKEASAREARAEAVIHLSPETLKRINDRVMPKGNVYEAARLAGVMAAKKTWDLIPLCHPIQITGVDVDFSSDEDASKIRITSRVRTLDRTGVEMEALAAAAVAALTIYDMCKAIDRGMTVESVRLLHKSGGRSGTYDRE